MGFSRHSNFINNVGKTHLVSMDHWMQIKERSENAKDVIKEYDNATKVFGKTPTPGQILEMERYKGVTYQRKGNEDTTKTDQNIPKAITPPTSELNIDLGGWLSNAEVLVPVVELTKIPSQKEKLLTIEGPPKKKIIEKHMEPYTDALLYCKLYHNKGNGVIQPFFISLMVNNFLLHNCMLDS
jgi:hypothetical protein